ncbi:MAG: hypothetical protein ACHP7K_11145, partial [Actinomycetales bacterium]
MGIGEEHGSAGHGISASGPGGALPAPGPAARHDEGLFFTLLPELFLANDLSLLARYAGEWSLDGTRPADAGTAAELPTPTGGTPAGDGSTAGDGPASGTGPSMPPRPGAPVPLAAAVRAIAGVDPEARDAMALTADELLDYAAACQRLISWTQARQIRALSAFSGYRTDHPLPEPVRTITDRTTALSTDIAAGSVLAANPDLTPVMAGSTPIRPPDPGPW